MTFSLAVDCPGCGQKVPLSVENAWVVLDKPYCSIECANAHALSDANVDSTTECPVCIQRQVKVGRTGKKRCANDHVWEDRNGVPMYLRDLTTEEIAYLKEQGLHA